MPGKDFYCRYYVGHKGKFGHEFLEFEFQADGKLRYANNSNYKNDTIIRKEVYVSSAILNELERIIEDAGIMQEDDSKWPEPDRAGRQELEIITNNDHISFATTKLGSMVQELEEVTDTDHISFAKTKLGPMFQVTESRDAEGLRIFYYLVQDLKTMAISIMNAHFRINPYH